jgi:restriction system protein
VESLSTTPVWLEFAPTLSLVDKIVPSRRARKQEAARREFLSAENNWKGEKERNDLANATASNQYLQARGDWEKQKKSHENAQVVEMNALRDLYVSKDPTTINGYCKVIIERSTPLTIFPKTHSYDYVLESHTLVVNCDLPVITNVPQVREVRYVEGCTSLETVLFPSTWLNEFYDQLIYKSSMRTIYILFQSDTADALNNIVFNGRVKGVDRATGHEVNTCILSVQTSKTEFMKFNLSEVDPKACFKRLKGVSSQNMSDLEPVVPIEHVRGNSEGSPLNS